MFSASTGGPYVSYLFEFAIGKLLCRDVQTFKVHDAIEFKHGALQSEFLFKNNSLKENLNWNSGAIPCQMSVVFVI